jgi:hypothetical protein
VLRTTHGSFPSRYTYVEKRESLTPCLELGVRLLCDGCLVPVLDLLDELDGGGDRVESANRGDNRCCAQDGDLGDFLAEFGSEERSWRHINVLNSVGGLIITYVFPARSLWRISLVICVSSEQIEATIKLM